MEKWEFKPLVSIGNIRFGMNRNEVHSLFKESCTEFKKNRFSKNTADDYGRFHVFYSSDDKVEAVEIFDDIEIYIEDSCIYPIKTDEIEQKIKGITKDGSSYTHIGKSIGIEAPEDRAESIFVGAKGYYA